jgi:hypothetical protein
MNSIRCLCLQRLGKGAEPKPNRQSQVELQMIQPRYPAANHSVTVEKCFRGNWVAVDPSNSIKTPFLIARQQPYDACYTIDNFANQFLRLHEIVNSTRMKAAAVK